MLKVIRHESKGHYIYVLESQDILSELPNNEIDQIREVFKWLEENFDKTDYHIDGYWETEYWPNIRFKNKESELVFKLRWS